MQELTHDFSLFNALTQLIFQEHPPTPSTVARALQAVVEALHLSSGLKCTEVFVRDFVLARLSGKDINSIWKVRNLNQQEYSVCLYL